MYPIDNLAWYDARMANAQLINYIRLQSRLGTSEQDIRTGLVPGGWTEEEIKDAFEAVRATPVEAVPKMPVKGVEDKPIVVSPQDAAVIVPDDNTGIMTPILFLSTALLLVLAVAWIFIVKIPAQSSLSAVYNNPLFQQYVVLFLYPIGMVCMVTFASWITGRRTYAKEKRPTHALLFALAIYILYLILIYICTELALVIGAIEFFGSTLQAVIPPLNLFVFPSLQVALIGFMVTEVLLMLSIRGTVSASSILNRTTYVGRTLLVLIAIFVVLYFTGILNMVPLNALRLQ